VAFKKGIPRIPAKAGFPFGSNKRHGIKAKSDLTPLTLTPGRLQRRQGRVTPSHQRRGNNSVFLLPITGTLEVEKNIDMPQSGMIDKKSSGISLSPPFSMTVWGASKEAPHTLSRTIAFLLGNLPLFEKP
jgi:hypothetical protein